jgi:Vault protein inter-alpha-trypsin domain/von Willebrand factor type A domain
MNENHDYESDSEQQLIKLLSVSLGRGAPPDEAFLSRLREQSTKMFLESEPAISPVSPPSTAMLIIRSLVGLSVAAAALLLGYIALSNRHEPFLFEAVDELAARSSYRVRLVVGEKESEAVGKPALGIRFADAGDRYSLSDGERSVQIDLTENRAVPVLPTTSDEMLVCHLLAGFLKSETEYQFLQAAEPKEDASDQTELVYFCETQVGTEKIDMRWIVDAATRLPRSIEFLRTINGRSAAFATLFVQAVNEPVTDEQIKIADTLTEDGRIGKFADVQGHVSLRPKAFTRWTPICAPGGILKPGDWVRTDIRGANAVAVQLVPESKLILGPGSLVELRTPTQIKVLSGEFELTADAKHPIELSAPDGTKRTVMSPEIFRSQGEKLVKLGKEPLWLSGFKGTTTQETLGSLIAKVDGRNVPLHVGYHKVSVEIRDQIARTTIEESFVNSTGEVLEGQFHFPLPADASISGFGMWVGDRLVEADIVEKQRAREIYETILREKRDPGLLEWSGGNLFKARVYPIPARSEKRIKIVYTQVLPREGTSYRYSYALQSELLRQHPVRELNLTVTVSSAVKLAAISCPTHPARLQQTEHSARAEFSAQEYAPTKDFEVVVQVEDDKQGVVMIPHRRGDDGYFLLLLAPPGNGPWQRDVVPDGEPLKLIVLADTSASMDRSSRKTQDEVLGALLGSLGPKDSFQLAACDVDCVWTADKPQPAEPKNIEAARTFLAKRRSMGWTDLDKAFAEAFQKCDGKTQVVYLGDGVVTTGDADGVAFSKRLLKLAEGKDPHPGPLPKGEGVTFHSIAVSSSYEAPVMKAIGSVGGGSVRNVSGEKGPQQTAKDLLAEISRPSLRNVNVKFNGLRTARVYPATLANLPLGTQQIVLGRYLPEGKDQTGEVIVTGTLAGKEVSYRTAVSLKDAESGNSFIPRLWARMHLDELLAQGTSQSVQDEIINLSEEYHLMTPYTSLLVLESDADRERFKVKRRFQMRDGERFFADARDKAQYELVQQQMRLAGNWRMQLRNRVLADLARMGRNPQLFDERQRYPRLNENMLGRLGVEYAGVAGRSSGKYFGMGMNGGDDGVFLGDDYGIQYRFGTPERAEFTKYLKELEGTEQRDFLSGMNHYEMAAAPFGDAGVEWNDVGGPGSIVNFETNLSLVIDQDHELYDSPTHGSHSFGVNAGRKGWIGLPKLRNVRGIVALSDGWIVPDFILAAGFGEEFATSRSGYPKLLPISLPRPPRKSKPAAELLSKQTQEVRDLVLALQREKEVRALAGGIEIRHESQSFDPRFEEATWKTNSRNLHSGSLGWLNSTATEGLGTQMDWCDAKERGSWSAAYEVALVRKAAKEEHLRWLASVEDYPLVEAIASASPDQITALHPAEDQVLLILGDAGDEDEEHVHQTRFLIDTKRHILLSVEERRDGKTSRTIKFADFVEVAGRVWPQTLETLDGEGRRISLTKVSVKVLTADEFAAELKAAQAARESSLTLQLPLPKLAEAKKALTRLGELTPEVYLRLLMDAISKQDWDQAHERLARLEELIKDKAWFGWLRLHVLAASRRHEELKVELTKMAGDLAAKPHDGDWTLSSALYEFGSSYLAIPETIELLQTLKPVYARSPEYLQRLKEYDEKRWGLLVNDGRVVEADVLRKELAERYPRDLNLQTEYVAILAERSDYDAAYAWLARTIADARGKWLPGEIQRLQSAYLSLLDQQGRYADKLEYLAPILAANPNDEGFYTQQLVALNYVGRDAEAEKLIKEWLAAKLDGKENEPARGRAFAAVHLAMNQIHPFGSRRYDVSWHQLLAEFVLRNGVSTYNTVSNSVRSILQDSQFSSSDEMPKVSKGLAAKLLAEVEKLAPRQLERLVEHVRNSRKLVSDEEWKKVAAAIQARWEKEKNQRQREILDGVLRSIYQETSAEARIAYLRLRVKLADDESRPDKQRQLFDELLNQSWTAEIEAETLALIDKLGSGDVAESRLLEQLSHLHRWTDQMLAMRNSLLESKIEKREQMTRQDLATKRKENFKLVQTELANRLHAAAKDRQDDLGRWLLMESQFLNVRAERDLPKVTEGVWQLLEENLASQAAFNKTRRSQDELEQEEIEALALRDQLHIAAQSRLVSTLVHLAAQTTAKPQDADRVFKLCDEQIALPDKQKEDEDAPPSLDWRQVKYHLLVALDRPKDLAGQLAKWSAADTMDRRWQKALAQLNAELGKLDEAIKLFEGLQSSGELTAVDYSVLATWYQTTKQDAKNAGAKLAMYKVMDESALGQMLSNRAQNAAVTPDDLLAYQAFFAKASSPQAGLGAVEKHYRSTHDFRLLAGLADAVIGHTSGEVYPFLSQVDSVLDEIHDEATVDELVKRIGEVREETKTPVDMRAIDLLELLVERRGAQLQNQAGPHLAAAVAALQRAEKREWSPGEPVQFAQMLAADSFTEQPALAQEQIRIITTLHEASEKGSLDRLKIADLISVVHWRHDRRDQGIDNLSAGCDEYRSARQGKSTHELRPYLYNLLGRLQEIRQYVRGERLLQEEMTRAATPQDAYQLRLRLFELYSSAVYFGGDTSLGKDEALFAAVEQQLLVLLTESKDQRQRLDYLHRLCSLFSSAHHRKLPAAKADLAQFVAKTFPGLAQRQINNYRNMVSTLASTVREVLGPRDALAFYIERMEHEPAWLTRTGDDGWNNYHNELAHLREEVADLGALEPRLLALVVAELQHHMRTHSPRGHEMYYNDYNRFWKEKAADFAKAAEEVLAENKDGSASIQYISGYLINGLDLVDRGIEILFDAHRRELLDDSGQQLLITALFRQKRHGEAVPLLEALVRKQPKAFGWRTQLMHAYFKSRQPRALLKQLAETHKLFIDPYPNGESNLAAMAASTLENELYEHATSYYEKAIKIRTDALHSRTQGDSTLAGYFQQQAKAYAGLGNTALAVDKASAAIVIWPARHDQRQEAIDLLRSMLNLSLNLDAYVAELDKEVEKTQQDRPIVRQQIGTVYQEKFKAWDKAIKQFRLALEGSPSDPDLHQRLIACLDAKGDAAGALVQSLDSLELSRRNLDLWGKLAARFTALKDPIQAERAATSLVEVAPHEADGHEKLASYRQKQDRWDEAISHWQEVAKLRKLEPTGLLGLAPALLHQKRLEEFDAALKQLDNGPWPQHFQEKLKEELPKLRESRLKAGREK